MRRLITAAILLVGGGLVAVLVAMIAAVWSRPVTEGVTALTDREIAWAIDRGWVSFGRRAGADAAEELAGPTRWWFSRSGHREIRGRGARWRFVEADDLTPVAPTEPYAALRVLAGWPWLALEGSFRWPAAQEGLLWRHPPADLLTFYDELIVEMKGGEVTLAGAARRPVPIMPAWPGLLADAAVYAVVLGVLLAAVSHLRAWFRRRRARCSRCGYDRRHAGDGPCPECGALEREVGHRGDAEARLPD